MTAVVAALLPPQVVSRDAVTDPAPDDVLYPAEAAVVARAVDKRRREFATVRHCARLALADLGVAAAPILPGERGAPQWPAGVVGSMTHCDGYRAAAVARADTVGALGVDAEPHEPLPDGVAQMVVRPEEAAMLARLSAVDGDVCWDRLLFSAKETVYKVWFPLARRWLEFHEATVTLAPDGGFHARLLVEGPSVGDRSLTEIAGRWSVATGVVLTAASVPTS